MVRKRWRHADDQDGHERISQATAISFAGRESRTVQAERDNCDLNVLVRRFGVEPLMRPVDPNAFGVIDRTMDLLLALEQVANAEAEFMRLPATMREQFNNDPLELLAALEDPSKRTLLEDIGIFNKPDPAPAGNRSSGSRPEGDPTQDP